MPNEASQEQKPQKTSWGVILVLVFVVVAIVAGAYYAGSLLLKQPKPSELPPVGQVSRSERPTLPSGLTLEEQQAFQFPGEEATQEEDILHFQLVQSLAKEADSLSYIDCVADPIIFKIGKGEQFQAWNRSAEEISLSIQGKEYRIPANGKQELVGGFEIVDPNRPTGAGIYEVACSSQDASSVSIIFVTE